MNNNIIYIENIFNVYCYNYHYFFGSLGFSIQ